MEQKQTPELKKVCTSVFKNGENHVKDQLTGKWITLINQIEKEKAITAKE